MMRRAQPRLTVEQTSRAVTAMVLCSMLVATLLVLAGQPLIAALLVACAGVALLGMRVAGVQPLHASRVTSAPAVFAVFASAVCGYYVAKYTNATENVEYRWLPVSAQDVMDEPSSAAAMHDDVFTHTFLD